MSLLHAAGFTIFPNIGGWLGSVVTMKQVRPKDGKPSWYDTLNKPSWRPPNWAFGPVWTSLYCGMGYASFLVYRDGGGFHGGAQLPMILFGSQLTLNWLWTPIFFHYHQLKWSSFEIMALYATVAACGISFYRVNPVAGYLFVPYLAWLSIATPLNVNIWLNNKDKDGVVITEVKDDAKTK